MTATDTTIARPISLRARILNWVGDKQAALSVRAYAQGDAEAVRNGWTVTESTGALGFGARTYHDPRFATRRPG